MSRANSNRVSASSVPHVLQMMLEAPERVPPPKTELTLRELISQLYDSIMTMKAKGHRAEDICAFMEQNGGISIAKTTLNTYLSREKKARKQKKRKPSPAQVTLALAPAATQPPIDISDQLDAIPEAARKQS